MTGKGSTDLDLRIVSGGQTGVDRAALDAALCAGLAMGGWCPRNRRAEDGIVPAQYPLTETPSGEYAERTEWNVRDSDATLIVGSLRSSPGTAQTREFARLYGRPCLELEPEQHARVGAVVEWMRSGNIRVLNVAGPRESERSRIYEQARSILDRLFEAWRACR